MKPWTLIFALGVSAGCEKPVEQPVANVTTGQTVAKQATVSKPLAAAPEDEEPSAPDFEDYEGVVRLDRSGSFIDVAGQKPLCLPFETPADLRKDGTKIRFTGYLKGETGTAACRKLELISARAQ